MARRDDQDALLLVLGIGYLLWRKWLDSSPAAAIKDAGSKVYDVLHNDSGHKQDLPGKQWTRAQIEDLAKRHGFPDPHMAYAIVMAESGGVPRALTVTDREESVGLFQINIRAHRMYTREQMQDPEQNASAAYQISKGGTNWKPWSVYKTGRYKKFL